MPINAEGVTVSRQLSNELKGILADQVVKDAIEKEVNRRIARYKSSNEQLRRDLKTVKQRSSEATNRYDRLWQGIREAAGHYCDEEY